MNIEKCAGCHHHCLKNELRCDRGRRLFFGSTEEKEKLQLVDNLNKVYLLTREKGVEHILKMLSSEDKTVLSKLSQKIIEQASEKNNE